jgi:hypothetical protein
MRLTIIDGFQRVIDIFECHDPQTILFVVSAFNRPGSRWLVTPYGIEPHTPIVIPSSSDHA